MVFKREFFLAVEQSEVEIVINFLEKENKQSDIDQVFESEGSSIHHLSALAISISKLIEKGRTSSLFTKDCIEIIVHLLINGANIDIKYNFPGIPEAITPFAYLCLKGELYTVQALFDYFNITEDKSKSIIELMKKYKGNEKIIKFLENPTDYTYLYPESYTKLASSKSKLVEGAQLILKDYYAPLVLEFLHWPALQRLLTFHANRNQDNLILAEMHVKGIVAKKTELEILSKGGVDLNIDNLLLQEYISRLLRLNSFIVLQIENNKINPKGSFCRRIHFLNQELVKYVLDEQRKSACTTPITPLTLFQPIKLATTDECVSLKPIKINLSRLPCGKQTAQDLFTMINLVDSHVGSNLPFHTLSESSYLNSALY